MRHALDGHTINRLAASASIDPSTVRRFLRGERVQRTTLVLLTQAAQQMGVTLPMGSPNASRID